MGKPHTLPENRPENGNFGSELPAQKGPEPAAERVWQAWVEAFDDDEPDPDPSDFAAFDEWREVECRDEE